MNVIVSYNANQYAENNRDLYLLNNHYLRGNINHIKEKAKPELPLSLPLPLPAPLRHK